MAGTAGASDAAGVLAAERRTDVARAIASLPRRQREVAVFRYHLDLDVAEIAAALGVPEGTVKSARTELDGISAAQDASEGPIRSLLLYRVDVSPATPPIGRANLTRLAV